MLELPGRHRSSLTAKQSRLAELPCSSDLQELSTHVQSPQQTPSAELYANIFHLVSAAN